MNGYGVRLEPSRIPMLFAGKVVLDGPDGHTVRLRASLGRPGGLPGVDLFVLGAPQALYDCAD
jgi:hypothetical protein